MKDRKIFLGYFILVIVLVASIICIFLFGNMDISFLLNIFFSLLMFIILLMTMKSIKKYVNLINSIKKGTDYINSVDHSTLVNTKDGYNYFPSNEKLNKALTTYFKENSEYDGDIAEYITEDILEEEIDKHVTELASGAMTGLGLLGTFVGLIIGLRDLKINQDELMESIKTLMDGMKTAFLTSIFGVIYSLVFNAYYKKIYSWGQKELNNFYDAFYSKVAANPDNKNINQIINNQSVQIMELEKLPSTIAAVMAEEINKVFSPTVNKMDTLMEQFVSVATSNQQESLGLLVNSFVDSMNEILNDKFVLLGDTLDKTCELQKANFEMMDKVVNTISSQTSHLSELNDSIEKSLENIQNYESQIEKFNDSIIEHNNESHRLITEVLESQNNTHSAVQNFTENITDATSYINQVRDVVSNLETINSDSTSAIRQYCNETNNAISALNNQVKEFSSVSGNLINEIKTVGSRIHLECDGLESSLGSSLNSTFKVFDENLAEVTTHLNSSIKEMQALVDRLPRDLYISIGKLKESMDNCVSKLNDYNDSREDD